MPKLFLVNHQYVYVNICSYNLIDHSLPLYFLSGKSERSNLYILDHTKYSTFDDRPIGEEPGK